MKISGAVRRLSLVLGAISGVGTAVLMLTVVPDLIARSAFGEAVYGMAETGIFVLVIVVFLALSTAQVRKEHFHVGVLDSLVSRETGRLLWIGRHAVSAVVCGVFTWYAAMGAIASTRSGEQSYAVIEYPIWPAKIVVAVGLLLLTVQFLMDCYEAIRTPQYVAKGVHESAPESASAL
ncbi:MAG: TRAP transporter small permease subunit [Gammaproteobacteria bacterium]|nr:TRAP transporter small permease subunit [Gammaproteobacteria bacterium]MBU1442140.1 TRAP transporter small permease subunit [Gammaproteobacteria bacterium]